MDAMEAEHCKMAGSDYEFTTGNYHVTTRPRVEWRLVAGRRGKQDQDFEGWVRGPWLDGEVISVGLGAGAHGRRIPDLDELMKLPVREQACLREEEVMAIVLYTGPMVSLCPPVGDCCLLLACAKHG